MKKSVLQSLCSIYQHIFTPPRNRGGVIFSLQFVCVCVRVSVRLSVCLLARQRANHLTNFDAVFVKWCLISVVRSNLKMMTLGKRSRSQSQENLKIRKKFANKSNTHIFEFHWCQRVVYVITDILIPNMFISYKKQAQKLNDKIGGKWSIKKNYRRRDFNLGPFTWNTSALDHLALQKL